MNRIAAFSIADFGLQNADLRIGRNCSFNPQSEIRIPQLNAGLLHVKVVMDWKPDL